MRDRDFEIKPRFRVFHGVSELGIGARIAKTRARLAAITAAVLVGFVAYSRLSTAFMRSESTSVTLNLLLITGAMLFMLLLAYVMALLAGDLFFPGDWRERVILGRKAEVADDEAVEAAIGKLKDQTLPFYAIFGVLLVLNYLLYGWVSGGFLSEYHDWGYQYTLLRSGDAEAELRGIRNVANPRNVEAQREPEVRAMLVELAADAHDEEARAWATWAVGELHIYEGADALIAIVSDDDTPDALRARAAESLGRLASREGAAVMGRLLARSFGRDELALGLLRGLGLAQVASTAPYIEPMLRDGPRDIRGTAFWALGRTGNQDFHGEVVEYLEEGSDDERCFAAEALKFLATPDDRVAAHAWFASAPSIHCEPVVWTSPYHWSEDESFRTEIVVDESLRAKLLKVVFTAGGVSERDFFARLANDPDETDEIRALARELALRIEHRQ